MSPSSAKRNRAARINAASRVFVFRPSSTLLLIYNFSFREKRLKYAERRTYIIRSFYPPSRSLRNPSSIVPRKRLFDRFDKLRTVFGMQPYPLFVYDGSIPARKFTL